MIIPEPDLCEDDSDDDYYYAETWDYEDPQPEYYQEEVE